MSSNSRPPDGPGGPRRFHTNVRHYHRPSAMAGTPAGNTGNARPGPRPTPLWLKIVGIVAGTAVLAGIVTGLIIELSA